MRISSLALASAFALVPMMAMAQEAPKDEATTVGGRVRVTNTVYTNKDLSVPTKYGFNLDRARVWMNRTVKGNTEGYVQFRFESNQNGADNEGTAAVSDVTSAVNRAYINFKEVAPGLNIQAGKNVYKFADDADYGLGATDAQDTFAKVNGGYGLGLFADYKIPGDFGMAHIAFTNGNGKTNSENNSQKAFVSYFKLAPMKGLGVNFGYAVDTLRKLDKNVVDTYYTAGVATSQDLTFVNLGLEYNMRTTKKGSDLYDAAKTSGSGIAARVGYKLDALNLVAVYNMLQRDYKDVNASTLYGTLATADKTKTPKSSTLVAAAEYTVGGAIVGAQYKMITDTAKIAKNKDGALDGKSYGEAALYTQLSF